MVTLLLGRDGAEGAQSDTPSPADNRTMAAVALFIRVIVQVAQSMAGETPL